MKQNKHPTDRFLEVLNEQRESVSRSINHSLEEDIWKTVEQYGKTNDVNEKNKIVDALRERCKNIDLNQVTDLYIHFQIKYSANFDPVPLPSIICIKIGKMYKEENLHYAATKVYDDNEVIGGCALEFLIYLAIQKHHRDYVINQKHHRDYVINFIKENFEGFSPNMKTECVFHLKEYFPDDETVQKIVEDSGITEYKLIFSTNVDSTAKPITFKFESGNNEHSKESETESVPESNDTTELKENHQDTPSNKPWWKF